MSGDKWVTVGQYGNRKSVYHDDPNCENAGETTKKVSQSEMEYYEMRECKYCAGNVDYANFGREHLKSLKEAAKND